MKHTRSRRRVRRVTRRKGAGLRECFGRWCGSTRGRTEAPKLNAVTTAALKANSIERATIENHARRLGNLYGHAQPQGTMANALLYIGAKVREGKNAAIKARRNTVLLKENAHIAELEGELQKLKSGRYRAASLNRLTGAIENAKKRRQQISKMSVEELIANTSKQ